MTNSKEANISAIISTLVLNILFEFIAYSCFLYSNNYLIKWILNCTHQTADLKIQILCLQMIILYS